MAHRTVNLTRIDLTGEVRDSDLGPWIDIICHIDEYRIPVASLVLEPRNGESLMNCAARTVADKLRKIFDG